MAPTRRQFIQTSSAIVGAASTGMLGSALGSAVVSAQEPITLRMLRPWPIESNDCLGYRKFIETVNRIGEGKVHAVDVGGSEVFPPNEQMNVLSGGQVDLLYTSTGYIASTFPEASALIYQFGHTPTQVREAGVIDRLDAIVRETNGVSFLGIPWWANAHIWLKTPINSLEELKSRKLRSHPSYDALVKGLGISTVNISFSELYTALDRGVIDGIAFPYFDIKTYGLDKVLRHRVDPPFWRAGWVILLANVESLDKLPDDVREIVFNAMLEIERNAPELYDALAEEESQQLAAEGLTTISISDEEWYEAQRVAWEEGLPNTMRSVSPKYGQEIVDLMAQFYPPDAPFKSVGLK